MEQIPQIKDKITAKAYALYIASRHQNMNIISLANNLYNWLIKNITLPDVQDDYTSKLIEMMEEFKRVNNATEELTNKLAFKEPSDKNN